MPHPTLRRTLLLSLMAAATTATIAAPAQAAGPFEPNDTVLTASTGPFVFGERYLAALETEDDVDLYRLDLSGVPASVEDLEIEVGNFPSSSPRCLDIVALTSSGETMPNGRSRPTPCYSAQSGWIQILRPADDIVLLRVAADLRGGAGTYDFRVRAGANSTPAGDLAYDSGFRARLSGVGADDTQAVYVTDPAQKFDETEFGETTGATPRNLRLYSYPSEAVQVTFESTSTDRGWSWDWTLTSQNGPAETKRTVFRESASGVSLVPIVSGLTRRVTVDGIGRVLSSRCADGVIAVPCGNVPRVEYPTYPVVAPTPVPAPIAAQPVATPAPLPKPVSTTPAKPAAMALVGTFKVSGKGRTVKGKLSASNPSCLAGAKVSLVQKAAKPKKGRKAKKDKTLGSTRSKANGSWVIKLKKAAKGKTFVAISPAAKNAAACAPGQSKTKTL